MRGFFIWLVVALAWRSGLAAETKASGENSDPDYQQFMSLAPTTPKPPTAETKASGENSDPDYQQFMTLAPTTPKPPTAETKASRENSDPEYQQFMTLAPTTPNPPTVTEMNLDFADRLLKQIQYELDSTRNASSDLQIVVGRYDFQLYTIKVEKTRLVEEMAPRRADLLSKKQKLAQARAKLEHSWLLLERCPIYERLDDYVRQNAQRLADTRAVAELEPMARKRYLLRYLRLLKSLERLAARANLSSTPYQEPVPRGE